VQRGPRRDGSGNERWRARRQGRALGKLPEPGQLWRRRRDADHEIQGTGPVVVRQGNQPDDEAEEWVHRRWLGLFQLVKAKLDRRTAVTIAFFFVVGRSPLGLGMLATGEEFQSRQDFEQTV
jgi:hypothetical protein